MRLRALVLIQCLLVAACSGTVVTTGTGGQGGTSAAGNGGKQSTGGLTGAGGSGACAPIPTAPEYDCVGRPRLPGDCGPWTETGAQDPGSSLGYPQNCNVRLPRPDSFSGGCGPQQCQCSQFPDANGTFAPAWVCPL
ncbi:MAG TPA: hypothetical protein VF395_14345 [Polyangiaceae bacterium]